MTIPFEIPSQWMAGIISGKYIRYGSILKDSVTGSIVGHLQEAGGLGVMQSIVSSTNPLSAIVGVANTSTGLVNTYQLAGLTKKVDVIMEQMKVLQMTSQIGAAASILGLGVSIAGFKMISDKLDRLTASVEAISQDIQWVKMALSQISANQDALNYAAVKQASQNLVYADTSHDENTRRDLATKARDQFQLFRNYNHSLLQMDDAFSSNKLTISGLSNLVRDYEYCCAGELYADFLLGDIDVYTRRIEDIQQEHAKVLSFDPLNIFDIRCDAREMTDINFDLKGLSESLLLISKQSKESQNRFDSTKLEVDYIKNNQLTTREYQKELQTMEPSILLLPV